jgi:hypothetical protein
VRLVSSYAKVALSVGFGAAFVGYLGLLYMPPRIEIHINDTIFYMSQAHDLTQHRPIQNHTYPTGYARILALTGIDMGRPWYRVVLINLVFLSVGLASTYKLLPPALGLSNREAASICLMSLFSWLFISYAPKQLPELTFFGTTCASLFCLSKVMAKEGRPFWAFLGGGIFGCVAILVRSVGVALLPVMLYVLLAKVDRKILRWAFPILCALGLVLGLTFRHTIMSPAYSEALTDALRQPGSTLLDTALWRIQEVGEVGQNVSQIAFEPREQLSYGDEKTNRVVPLLPETGHSYGALLNLQAQATAYVVGALFWTLIGFALWRKRITVVDVYLAAYLFILMVYRCGEVRYFVPIVPLVLAYAWAGTKALPFPVPRWCVASYVAVFILFGTIAMANEWTIAFVDREQSYQAFDDIVGVFQHRFSRGL